MPDEQDREHNQPKVNKASDEGALAPCTEQEGDARCACLRAQGMQYQPL